MKKINFTIILILLFTAPHTYAAEPSVAQYACKPIFQSNTVQPAITIILDNSGSMNQRAYGTTYDPNTKYYGYFEPGEPAAVPTEHTMYSYGNNKFTRDSSGPWDGNFLNWATMRRIDVTRKVLMGGKATSRTGGGNQTLIGEDPSGREYWVSTGQILPAGVSPYTTGKE